MKSLNQRSLCNRRCLTLDSMHLTPAQKATHDRLMGDFEYYAEHSLKVSPAGGGEPVPLILNPAQRYAQAVMEKQKAEQGWVRVIELKARRLGFSTHAAGRIYHSTSTQKGQRAFILSHHSKTTQTLFNIVKQFRKEAPVPIQPDISASNVYQIIFDVLGSEYAVGTAGSAEIGRGLTIQKFHGSEVAFWENTSKIMAGVIQTIELLPGTEIIFESTANGKGNLFHRMCMDAAKGLGDYILIFAPWHWHPAYSRKLPENFQLDADEIELKNTPVKTPSATGLPLEDTFLTDEQLYWRRMKLIEFRNESDPIGKFKQEYPATIAEAFQKGGKTLVLPSKVASARISEVKDPGAALVMGCDLSRTGTEIVFSYRRGREFIGYEKIPHVMVSDNPTNILTSIVAQRIESRGVDLCFLDYGHGHGVFDNLEQIGYKGRVRLVHFNERALEPDIYLNKRTEIYMLARNWLHEGGVSIPDSEELEINLLTMPDAEQNARELFFLLNKKKIEDEAGVDLGIFDSFALTFSYPVARNLGQFNDLKKVRMKKAPTTSSLKTKRHLKRGARDSMVTTFNWGGVH